MFKLLSVIILAVLAGNVSCQFGVRRVPQLYGAPRFCQDLKTEEAIRHRNECIREMRNNITAVRRAFQNSKITSAKFLNIEFCTRQLVNGQNYNQTIRTRINPGSKIVRIRCLSYLPRLNDPEYNEKKNIRLEKGAVIKVARGR